MLKFFKFTSCFLLFLGEGCNLYPFFVCLNLKNTYICILFNKKNSKKMKRLFPFLVILMWQGCATTYTKPTTKLNVLLTLAPPNALEKAKKILFAEGYETKVTDGNTLTTNFKRQYLKVDDCDCGKTMGIDYMKDKRTVTNVQYAIMILGNDMSIKANIQGEYLKTHETQGVQMDCVSKGVIEKQFLEKLQNTN